MPSEVEREADDPGRFVVDVTPDYSAPRNANRVVRSSPSTAGSSQNRYQ
jgi:hypothetical protein